MGSVGIVILPLLVVVAAVRGVILTGGSVVCQGVGAAWLTGGAYYTGGNLLVGLSALQLAFALTVRSVLLLRAHETPYS